MEEADQLRHHKETIKGVIADVGDAYFRCHECIEDVNWTWEGPKMA